MRIHIKQENIKRLYRAQNRALYWLFGIVCLGFLGLQLGRIQAIADFNYSLHEMMYFPFIFALFAAPIVFVIYIFLLCKFLLNRGKQKANIKTGITSIFVIASIVVIISITIHQSYEVTTGGVFEVEEKFREDRNYYLVLNDKKIKVSSEQFHLVEKNQQYSISFVWNKRTPNIGELETIEPVK